MNIKTILSLHTKKNAQTVLRQQDNPCVSLSIERK